MKYIIWYDSVKGEYNWGDLQAYKTACDQTAEDTILAEEFMNVSVKIVEKITSKLNKNLILVKQ